LTVFNCQTSHYHSSFRPRLCGFVSSAPDFSFGVSSSKALILAMLPIDVSAPVQSTIICCIEVLKPGIVVKATPKDPALDDFEMQSAKDTNITARQL
jgi:hypothetical protein